MVGGRQIKHTLQVSECVYAPHHVRICCLQALYFAINPQDKYFRNVYGISIYLFPPGWIPSFAVGVAAYFLFARLRHAEKPVPSRIWYVRRFTMSRTHEFLAL